MNGNYFVLKKDGLLIAILIIVHTICWFALRPVYPQSDPLCYFLNAKKILEHTYSLTHSIVDHRYGTFIPVAFLVGLLGENPYTINLWTLLCSLMTIFLVYFFCLNHFSRIVAFTAGLLLSVNLIQIIFSAVLFPDVIVSFFAFCCVYFIYQGRKERKYWFKYSILFIICFGFGFLAKESIILIIPFTGFIFLKDLVAKKPFKFSISVTILLILFSVLLFVFSKFLTNDFTFYYKTYERYRDFDPFPNFAAFLKRITYQPWVWFNIQYGYIFLVIFSIPAFISGIKKRNNFSTLESFTSLYFIFVLMCLWWGTVSILNFGALAITDRRWMLLIVPLCILSALTIFKIIHEKNTFSLWFVVIVLAVLGIVNIFYFPIMKSLLFFAFATTLLLQKIVSEKCKYSFHFKIALTLLPFIFLAFYFLLNNSNYVVSQPA